MFETRKEGQTVNKTAIERQKEKKAKTQREQRAKKRGRTRV